MSTIRIDAKSLEKAYRLFVSGEMMREGIGQSF